MANNEGRKYVLSRYVTDYSYLYQLQVLDSVIREEFVLELGALVAENLVPWHDSRNNFLIILDGPVSCGKSIALACLFIGLVKKVGWYFFVPRGREWTHGGFFYIHPQTGLWHTPVQAENVLKDFLNYNEFHLKQLPCQIFDPRSLGEGAGVGWLKDVDSMAIPEGTSLYDLVNKGINQTHAAVGVVVRLRKELSLVKDIPVPFAIDQYNNWLTFSEYEEPVTVRSCQPIHAIELAMVKAFRSMIHDDMTVGAFSHSTAAGKLRNAYKYL